MNQPKVTISFDCTMADTAEYLLMVYELTDELHSNEYMPGFKLERLPDLLEFIFDMLGDYMKADGTWFQTFSYRDNDLKYLEDLMRVKRVK